MSKFINKCVTVVGSLFKRKQYNIMLPDELSKHINIKIIDDNIIIDLDKSLLIRSGAHLAVCANGSILFKPKEKIYLAPGINLDKVMQGITPSTPALVGDAYKLYIENNLKANSKKNIDCGGDKSHE